MIKVGILTFHRTTNFGSMLQAYGLYKAVSKIVSECEIIDYRCPAIENREHLKEKISFTNPKKLLKILLFQPAQNKKAKSLMHFADKKMKMSDAFTPDSIYKCEDGYNRIIVGSDIVWGRDITAYDYNYFLDFVTDSRKKYAFSSSVGTNDIIGDEEKLNELLNQFQMIAVRERDAVDWVKRISGREASWVCDPTMLLTASEWKREINLKKYRDDYVLVYFEDPKGKALDDAIKYATKFKKKVFLINYGVPKRKVVNIKPKSLEEFLGLIQSANCVFTASYHGMLFSVYFQKSLFFYTRAHAARMLSISNRIGLNNRCGDEIDILCAEDIDYRFVNEKVEEFRNESLEVLEKMLEV